VSDHDLKTLSVEALLEKLGRDVPTPGGGSAAAVAGALGASMVRMLALLTVGKKDYEAHAKLMQAVAEQAAESAEHLLRFSAKDAEAYDQVTAAYGLSKETEEEQEARAAAIQEALKGATEVPLRIMEECLQVISLAKNVVESGYRNAVSDGASGAVLARAGLTAASFSVKANLAGITDGEYVLMTRTKLDEMIYMGTKVCTALDSYVNELWTRS
jgi:formiminotetrahydrofolate cyclodeaminase